MCVQSIKVPQRKKSVNLFNEPSTIKTDIIRYYYQTIRR